MTLPRLVLVDDHDILRAGATKFLDGRFSIVGEAADVSEAIGVISATQPDLVLIDVQMPSGTGADVVVAIKTQDLDTKFLALSVSAARSDVALMLDAGVDGYLLKSAVGANLPDLAQEVLDGGRPISPQIAGFMLDIDEAAEKASHIENLTERERDVVQFIARGYSYRKTATALFLSPKTVEAHMSNIFRKLGVASRYELSAEVYRVGWVGPESSSPG
ncbi:MAG: response regulator transcription factor [Actinomycetia bacterium]|nr:response regulator transcription factor [Actinomycetes bacterium]